MKKLIEGLTENQKKVFEIIYIEGSCITYAADLMTSENTASQHPDAIIKHVILDAQNLIYKLKLLGYENPFPKIEKP